MQLSPVMQKYVLHWGEMGTRWGVNRTVAQIHALLYLAPRPLPAEEIAETLSIARSNVSTSLRELQSWGLVKVVHVMGDRRDHFQSLQDVWETFQVILEERKRRELDPTLTVLRECSLEGESDPETDAKTLEKINNVLNFMELLLSWHGQIKRLPKGSLMALIKMGAKIEKLLGGRKSE